MTIFGPVLDVRPLLTQERRELLGLLRSLKSDDWSAATVCPGWDVHDVVGHVLNDYIRRLSGIRDGFAGATFGSDETLPTYLARTNDDFVRATRQCSPELMIELLAHLGPKLDRLWTTFDLTARASLDVSWAGTGPSPAWLDIAREYTEYWVHQQQIRDAVGLPGADRPELVHPVLDTFLRALPHTLHTLTRPNGTVVRVVIPGSSGDTWHAMVDGDRWRMAGRDEVDTAAHERIAATVTIDADDFWRLATRGITVPEARRRARSRGDAALVAAMTSLLAVIA